MRDMILCVNVNKISFVFIYFIPSFVNIRSLRCFIYLLARLTVIFVLTSEAYSPPPRRRQRNFLFPAGGHHSSATA